MARFKTGDTVWFINDGYVKSGKVKHISTTTETVYTICVDSQQNKRKKPKMLEIKEQDIFSDEDAEKAAECREYLNKRYQRYLNYRRRMNNVNEFVQVLYENLDTLDPMLMRAIIESAKMLGFKLRKRPKDRIAEIMLQGMIQNQHKKEE